MPLMGKVKKLNPWYLRSRKTLTGYWVLRRGPVNDGLPWTGDGWWHWQNN
jgi:hypothetical protein